MDMVLFTRRSKHCFTGIYAEISGGKLTITRQELDDDDVGYGIDEAEIFTFFNEWHTAKLMKALQVETPHELLMTLKKRFRTDRYDTQLDSHVREFCDEHDIKYRQQIIY